MTAAAESPILSEDEITQRVHILHKLRDHLREQRSRFYKYLDLLEHEEKDIMEGNVDKLQFHTAMEKDLASEILNFQKVINPLNEMYRINSPDQDFEIPKLQESLEHIRLEVAERSERNQQLLQSRMEEVRNEIKTIKQSNKPKSIYDDFVNRPSMIDITT